MGYLDELDKTLALNVVIKIEDEYFSTHQVDAGIVIPEENIIVKQPMVNGISVDIRTVNTPIATASFKLVEYNYNETTGKIMADETQFLNKEAIFYVGHRTGSFIFTDYVEAFRGIITSVTKITNGYSIKCKETTDKVNVEAYNLYGNLETALLNNSTTLDVDNGDLWPNQGLIKVADEFMYFTGRSGNTLTGLQRGQIGTGADEHEAGETVYYVTEILQVNPLDFLLQLLLSKNGDGTNTAYDVLPYGPGIDPSYIDITGIEAIRDTYFLNKKQKFLVYDVKSLLKFIEKDLLPSINCRFITINGQISLSLLDQVDYEIEPDEIDENSIIGVPTWSLTTDKMTNVIEIKYDYNYATKKYESVAVLKDDDSINTFGERKPLRVEYKGVYTALGGGVDVLESGNRLLNRLSTPRGAVSLTCQFDKSYFQIGENARISHRYLPQQGGTLGFSDQLEIMSKNIDLSKATVKYKLEFTSYNGIRLPFIAPSPIITDVIDSKTVLVDDSKGEKAGYKVIFWDNDYITGSENVIDSVNGNIIKFTQDLPSSVLVGCRVKFVDYDQATEDMKARYAFIGSNTGYFNDGSKSYQIIY